MGIVIGILIPSEDFYPKMIASFIWVFIQTYTTLGLYKLIFTLIDSEYYEFEIKQVLPHISMILSYLTVIFLIGFFVATYRIFILDKLTKNSISYQIADYIGVIIGLYVAFRIMFFNTFIVDDRSGPIESLKQSIALTRDYTSKVLLLIVLILIMIILLVFLWLISPIVAVILFFLFAYPIVNIILIVTYRKLVYSHQDVDDDVAETL
jgi:ABC-type multidrug transport system fused ATPase/permease subunit